MTTPTTAGGAVLPVVAWLYHDGPSLKQIPDEYIGSTRLSFQRLEWCRSESPLTYRDTAQAEIDALRAELQAMTDDRDSWCAQASARTEDAVRFAAERDALKAAQPELRWCKHCGEGTVAGLCRATGKPVEQDDHARDAVRLDWIERKVCDVSRLGDSARTVRISWNNGADCVFIGPGYNATWREAIDAAMGTP